MNKTMRSRHLLRTLFALCIVSLLFSISTLHSYISCKNEIVKTAKNAVRAETDQLVDGIERRVRQIMSSMDAVRCDIRQGSLEGKELAKRIEAIVGTDEGIIDAGVVYVPNVSENKPSDRSIKYARKDGKIRPSETEGDYTQEGWYKQAATIGAGWSHPVFNESEKNYTATFAMPITIAPRSGSPEEAVGVLYTTMSFSWLKSTMDSLGLEKKDFGMILARDGTILYHPVNDMVMNQSNIFTLLEENRATNKNYEKQKAVFQKAVNGESGEGYNVARTGQSFWYFYRPIRFAGWTIVVNFMRDAIPFDAKVLRRQEIKSALGFGIFFILLSFILFKMYDLREIKIYKLWWVSAIFSVTCLIISGYTWYLALSIPLNECQQGKFIIDDAVSLNKFFVTSSRLSRTVYGKEPVYIPTGIYIQSIEFSSSNNIALSGYVWQRYPKKTADNVISGFTIPEAKTLSISEAYRFSTDGDNVIGWRFEAVIRQVFDYSKYPFDMPNISVWLRHADFMHNVFLVPDLKGYPFMNAALLPGLQPRLALPGYSFSGTFFNYESRIRNANFGLDTKGREARTPELHYNIIIKRNFFTPLISKFFPIFIVMSMLFIVMLSFTTDTEKQKNFGLTGLAVVGLVISFFFTTLLAQVDLRQQFNADGIIFLENFNFITYLVLLLSAVLAFLFASQKKVRFVQYEHCLIPKLFYWPVFAGLVLIVSLMYFY